MNIIPIPCLKDNFAYLIICTQTGEAAVVDPSEAAPVLRQIQHLGVDLVAVLNTHHHWDHVGGNDQLRNHYPHVRIYGHSSDRDRIPGQTDFLDEDSPVQFGKLTGSISHNPGHTRGAITYYFGDAAFSGDTLFAAGCGRLFEGTPAHMHRSLCQQIGARPPETKVYFGHEYTENNLRFAQSVEPDNQAVTLKLAEVRALRAEGRATTPTTLAAEWETNPFMRCDQPQLQDLARRTEPGNDLSPASVLGVVRRLKDAF